MLTTAVGGGYIFGNHQKELQDRINQQNNAIAFMDKRISFAGTIHPDVSVGLDKIHKSFSKVIEKQ